MASSTRSGNPESSPVLPLLPLVLPLSHGLGAEHALPLQRLALQLLLLPDLLDRQREEVRRQGELLAGLQ